jgi:hypothetical protein
MKFQQKFKEFFNWEVTGHHGFIPEGATDNKQRYKQLLSCLGRQFA